MQHKFLVDGYARNESGSVYKVIDRVNDIVILRLNRKVYGYYIKTDKNGNEYVERGKEKTSVIWPMC
jgi:hypothetical protein